MGSLNQERRAEMTSIKGFARGLPAKQLREDLQKADKDFLEALVFNEYYNNFCQEYADIKEIGRAHV